MITSGRGSIAQVHYTGDEAAKEIKKLLEAVIESEDEFELWEALVSRASDLEGGVTRNSSPSAIELVRNVYDCFLAKFPLFFGYWKKYADFEFSVGGTETAVMVYERGVSNVANSVDLWTHYCSFMMDTCHDVDTLRDLFERGARFVGLDFQSHPFWDKYIEFEERLNEPANAAKLHCRASQLIIYQFSKYYEKFRTLIASRPIEELGDIDLVDKLRAEVELENASYDRPALELDRQLRAKFDHHYYEVYGRTQQAVQARWQYENAIKRAYFHVTELEEADLENWRKYLDYEEKQGDFERISFLYERCLVTCALEDEFWLRYARWMFSQGKEEDCRIIYLRASCIFVPISHTTIRLNWARFEEKLERVSVARDIHTAILEQVPDHVETMLSLAGVVRRHEGNDAAVNMLESYIAQRNPRISGFLVAEQARILWRCKNAPEEARQLYHKQIDNFAASKHFWQKFLEFEVAQPSTSQDEAHVRIKGVHDLLRTKGRFSVEDAKELSLQYMQYLLDYGVPGAAEEYMLIDKEVNGKNGKSKGAGERIVNRTMEETSRPAPTNTYWAGPANANWPSTTNAYWPASANAYWQTSANAYWSAYGNMNWPAIANTNWTASTNTNWATPAITQQSQQQNGGQTVEQPVETPVESSSEESYSPSPPPSSLGSVSDASAIERRLDVLFGPIYEPEPARRVRF